MWKMGIMFYILAGPFVWMTLILFYTTSLKKDMFCTLANFGYDEDAAILDTDYKVVIDLTTPQYSDEVQRIAACIGDEDRYNGKFAEHASWRWPVFLVSIWAPVIFSLVEFSFNKIRLVYRHSVVVTFFALGYVALNYGGSKFLSKSELYPYLTVWDVEKPSVPYHKPTWEEGHNYWSDLWMFNTIWICGTVSLSIFFTFMHRLKMDPKHKQA